LRDLVNPKGTAPEPDETKPHTGNGEGHSAA
jgi:hypothetical protein